MMYHIRLNTYMTRLLLTIISIFTFTFSSFANEVDFTKDGHYHKLAEDFKMYSVCQAIHQNLGMFIVINYGVGANLKFPEKWKEQQKGLISNIKLHEQEFDRKLDRTMRILFERYGQYGFTMQGLEQQKRANQSNTTQGIIFSISSAVGDPDRATIIIKEMLDESVTCRKYESSYSYEE